jgi:hypothetical protein
VRLYRPQQILNPAFVLTLPMCDYRPVSGGGFPHVIDRVLSAQGRVLWIKFLFSTSSRVPRSGCLTPTSPSTSGNARSGAETLGASFRFSKGRTWSGAPGFSLKSHWRWYSAGYRSVNHGGRRPAFHRRDGGQGVAARMQGGRIVGAAINTPRQPLQPAGSDIVDRKVSRFSSMARSSGVTRIPAPGKL